jgi:hypothetical protein
MKFFLMLTGALVLSVSAAQAQTVVSGATVPGPVQSTSSGAPIGTSNAGGSARGRGRTATAPNMTRSDKKMMRKMGKVKYKATDEETKTQ